MVDLAARHAAVAADVEARVLAVLRSGRYIGGPVVDEAESALAQTLHRRYAVGVGSGTDALAIALLAAGVKAKDRVALPALSFFATAESVQMIGAVPVFVDVLPDRPLLDPAQVPEDVEIVVPVHLFGMRAEAPPGRRIVVTDAAQCLGWGHGAPGGVTSALSLYPTKTIGVAGDGGAVLTDDPEVVALARAIGSHGMSAPYVHARWGRNSRLDAVQAAVVLGHLPELARRAAARKAAAAVYDAAFQDGPVAPLPRHADDGVHQYVVLCPPGRRDVIQAGLHRAGIDTAVYYPAPMDAQPVFGGDGRSACPNAAAFCARALALPAHEGLNHEDMARVITAVMESA